ncbi:OmpA family protein [Legionella sp. km535]|uniref:C-OmpA-like family protein CmpA n=1 Tax=Legionella sp. km535 TaxID=2498107 RepID=UPI000F8D35B8|nr:C-OmpA-like family protein CmpA [Legionella sp. km535]RUR19509.1 OmpA family protein [Legionella sp. km535]
MSLNATKTRVLSIGLMICLLSSCFHPPYNNFRPDPRAPRKTAQGAAGGAAIGAIASGTVSGTLLGAGIGGAIGAASGLYKDSKPKIIKDLKKQDIEFIQYGDTRLLIVPTDKYFMFGSPRLNELCYPGLNNIIRLLKFYPKSRIYVAGFTDNVGSRYHKKMLSQAQAETMLTFLWANNIPASRLKAEGYGDKNAVSDNKLIHGSAQNRRIEIQWFDGPAQVQTPIMYTK